MLELAAIAGELTVDAAKFTFSGIPVEQQRPSRVEFARGTMAVADVSWSVANNPLVIGGSVGFAAEDPPLEPGGAGPDRPARAVGVCQHAGVRRQRQPEHPDRRHRLARRCSTASCVLQDAEVAIAEPRLVLSDLNGPIMLDGQRVVLDGIRGLANGGALALDGSLADRRAWRSSAASVDIQAQGVAIELIRGLRSELDALVTLPARPAGRRSITGDIRVVQSAYTETITLAAAGAAGDAAGVADRAAAVSRSRSASTWS